MKVSSYDPKARIIGNITTHEDGTLVWEIFLGHEKAAVEVRCYPQNGKWWVSVASPEDGIESVSDPESRPTRDLAVMYFGSVVCGSSEFMMKKVKQKVAEMAFAAVKLPDGHPDVNMFKI